MKKFDPIYISNAVAWVGISAAVSNDSAAKDIINYEKEAADGTN